MSSITIEVDGKELAAQAGEMLICVTDRNDIYIPRFCYHEKLSIAANCRMCLVEVERAPKPMPACATLVMDGMKVFTRSELAREAQKGTMEFLLINHPLDCPVCDQGGECPLQDQALGYGKDGSRFEEQKRSVPSNDIGPLVATEMSRCIHCTRCVRFGEEVAGVMEMGAPGRGENVKISTFLNRSIDSEVSGNIIDLCPVGALTSKPFRFSARSWELRDHNSISPHDCLGTNINIQTLRDEVERVLPIENPDINECWLADRDRFSYEAVNSEHRLTQPMINKDGKWKEVEWQTALQHAAAGIKTVIASGSASDVGGLASAASSLEEFFLLQKLLRSLGSENVDHRLQQCDFRDDDIAPAFPASEASIASFSDRQSIMLIGSNIRKEQPLLALRIRQSWKAGQTAVSAINPMDYDLNFELANNRIAAAADLVSHTAALAKAIADLTSAALPGEIRALASDADLSSAAKQMVDAGDSGTLVLGAAAQQHADASLLKAIAHWIGDTTSNKISILAPANSAAGWVANCLPGESGQNIAQMMQNGQRAFVLLATEPELDCIDGKSAKAAMENAEFVVQISPFVSQSVKSYANVLLPMAAFAEAAGTYINCEGKDQASKVAASPKGEARPAWKILRVLGNFLESEGFDYISLDDVMQDISQSTNFATLAPRSKLSEWRISQSLSAGNGTGENQLFRIADMPMYRGDVTLRYADALQDTADNLGPCVTINPATLDSLSVAENDQVIVRNGSDSATLPLKADTAVAVNCAHVSAGYLETASLGGHVSVTLEKA